MLLLSYTFLLMSIYPWDMYFISSLRFSLLDWYLLLLTLFLHLGYFHMLFLPFNNNAKVEAYKNERILYKRILDNQNYITKFRYTWKYLDKNSSKILNKYPNQSSTLPKLTQNHLNTSTFEDKFWRLFIRIPTLLCQTTNKWSHQKIVVGYSDIAHRRWNSNGTPNSFDGGYDYSSIEIMSSGIHNLHHKFVGYC